MRSGVYHVIMAGGSGTRFWPLSRSGRPKQFLTLAGDRPLIRQAYERALAMSGAGCVYIAAGREHREMVMEVLPELDPSRFIAEPRARNTAPCVGLAALRLARLDPDGVMVIWPADHAYTDVEALERAIRAAVEAARPGSALVTLGIRPARPETGYGYIEVEDEPSPAPEPQARRAVRFVEKPDAATARAYVASGRHLWNSGIFVWRTQAILRAIQMCAPALWRGLELIDAALGGPDEDRIAAEEFERMASISVDYAIMEKAPEVMVVPADPGWSDVGSWDAVAELHPADASGNSVAPARAEALRINSRDCFVFSESARFVALVGVEDLIVVDSGDSILICRKGQSQSVRAVVEALKARGRTDLV